MHAFPRRPRYAAASRRFLALVAFLHAFLCPLHASCWPTALPSLPLRVQ